MALLGFATFSLCASSLYIVNDLLDREHDRKHPVKRLRTFASGELGLPTGVVLALLLGFAAFGASVLLAPWEFTGELALYAVATFAYSLYFKRKLALDVLFLAGFYSVRILAGGAITGVEVTSWLIAFSTCFFLSLALMKRVLEIDPSENHPEDSLDGRGYQHGDLDIVQSAGVATAFLSIVVFSLYIAIGSNAQLHYRHPQRLWLMAPVLTYWFLRLWILAGRREVDGDPVLFAVRDPVSWISGLLGLGIVALSA
jgi:4-hydroxybenzoate polyprenyltransferase